MKKAAIYNPYWDTLGGGEKYTSSFADLLLKEGYKVDIQWESEELINKIKKRFDIDLKNAKIVEDVKRGDGYDLCFWVSDGSIPTLKSRNNILHFQFPFSDVNGKSLINKMKLFRIKNVVVNSEFTKQFIDKEYEVNSKVIYPPIDTKQFKPKRKENIILYVGRFSQLTQNKNQHILVNAFKKLYDSGNKDWKLILAGGGEVGSDEYIKNLREKSKSYPILIKVSPSFKEIKDLYGKAKIFWSAVGMGVDDTKDPLKVEHFGMTLVEAMSAKCFPIVTKLGGYKEIITEDSGIFFKTKSGLINKTNKFISNKSALIKMAKTSQERAFEFDIKNFEKQFKEIL